MNSDIDTRNNINILRKKKRIRAKNSRIKKI